MEEDELDLDVETITDEPNPLEDKFDGDVEKLIASNKEAQVKITELSQKLSEYEKASDTPEDSPEKDVEEEDKEDKPTEETPEDTEEHTLENYEEVKETYGQGMADIFDAAGVEPFAEWERFDNEGSISDEAYEKLEKVGYGREMVDQYLEGYASQRDGFVNETLDKLGGQEGAAKIQQWVANTWDPESIKAHNEILQSNDHAKISEHVDKLKEAYDKTMGVEPKVTVKGDTVPTTTTGDVYKNTVELQKDMASEEYKTNPAFRAEVSEKLSRSNLFPKVNFKRSPYQK